jgi:hypothetical protein
MDESLLLLTFEKALLDSSVFMTSPLAIPFSRKSWRGTKRLDFIIGRSKGPTYICIYGGRLFLFLLSFLFEIGFSTEMDTINGMLR